MCKIFVSAGEILELRSFKWPIQEMGKAFPICYPHLILPSYSLRSEILVIEMDVSSCILVLDTSILMTNNSKRREYIARVHNQMVQVTSKVIRGPSVCLQVRVTMSSGSKVANAIVFYQVDVVEALALSTLSSLAPIDTPTSMIIVTGVAMVAVISSEKI